MPTFIMKCPECKTTFDFLKLRKSSKAVCPKCRNTEGFEKQPTAPAIFFKGEGWQTTNFSENIDPTSVKGVKKIEKEEQRPDQKILYKKHNEPTGRRKRVKIKGMPEIKRKFALGKE